MPDVVKPAVGTKVAFGDVVQLSKERSKDPEGDGFERYIGLEHLEPNDLKVRRWGELEDGVTFTNVFRPGQVLFGKRRAYQRKVAVAEFSGVCSGDIYVLEPKDDQLLPELLPFICQSEPFYDYVISMSQGGLSPRVNWKALAEYEFALPPLEEQRRIAEALQSLESALNSNLEAQARLRVASISMIDGWVDSLQKQGRPPTSLLSLAVGKPCYGLNAPATEYQEGLPRYIRITDIDDDGNLSTAELVSVKTDDPDTYRIKQGDLLFARTGSVGKAYLANGSEENMVYAGYLIRFSLNIDAINPKYMFAYTRSSHYWSWVARTCRVGVQPNINAEEYGEMPIWLPGTRSEQDSFVCKVEVNQSAMNALEERVDRLRSVKRAIFTEGLPQ